MNLSLYNYWCLKRDKSFDEEGFDVPEYIIVKLSGRFFVWTCISRTYPIIFVDENKNQLLPPDWKKYNWSKIKENLLGYNKNGEEIVILIKNKFELNNFIGSNFTDFI